MGGEEDRRRSRVGEPRVGPRRVNFGSSLASLNLALWLFDAVLSETQTGNAASK